MPPLFEDNNWQQDEKNAIMERALEINLSKRRVRKTDRLVEPAWKVGRLDPHIAIESDSSSSSSGGGSEQLTSNTDEEYWLLLTLLFY